MKPQSSWAETYAIVISDFLDRTRDYSIKDKGGFPSSLQWMSDQTGKVSVQSYCSSTKHKWPFL